MELVNKIDEKELFAARSTADAAGDNIADTYAKKTEIPDVSDFVTQQELSTELNTKQDNLSTEQLYNIDNAVTSLAGVMAESKLTIEGGKITEYDGTPFAGGSSDIVHFDYNNGNPELSWTEIKAYMDTGKQLIIYDKTVATDGKTKLGYVSNYDKVNNFIQFTNVSNMVVEGETVNGINWAYVGNSLGWQRTFIRNGGSGGQTYTSPNETITVDNTNGTLEATKYAMAEVQGEEVEETLSGYDPMLAEMKETWIPIFSSEGFSYETELTFPFVDRAKYMAVLDLRFVFDGMDPIECRYTENPEEVFSAFNVDLIADTHTTAWMLCYGFTMTISGDYLNKPFEILAFDAT